jgi:hypothetical protein
VQLYRYFVSQSSEFCRNNPLCCFSTSVYYCCLFPYRLSPDGNFWIHPGIYLFFCLTSALLPFTLFISCLRLPFRPTFYNSSSYGLFSLFLYTFVVCLRLPSLPSSSSCHCFSPDALTEHHAMKAPWGRWGTVPRTPDSGTRWRCVLLPMGPRSNTTPNVVMWY